jgi:hypothetical protein
MRLPETFSNLFHTPLLRIASAGPLPHYIKPYQLAATSGQQNDWQEYLISV